MAGTGKAHLRPADETLVRIEDLVVEFPAPGGRSVKAVSGISLDVKEGETLGLVGESGCGKTTTARALIQLPPPTSGSVVFDGTDLTALSEREMRRQRTGMIFQQHHLIGRLTALQNVLMGRLAFHGTFRSMLPLPRADRLVAIEALDRVGLGDRALHRADQLSMSLFHFPSPPAAVCA